MYEQSILPLDWHPLFDDASFFVGESNQRAFNWVQIWPWPFHFCIYGPKGSGKTHLGMLWAHKRNATWLPGACASLVAPMRCYILDEVSLGATQDIFHFFNAVVEKKAHCLWLSQEALSRKVVSCPSLQSRFSGMNCVAIDQPDDVLLENVLKKAFLDRGMTLTPMLGKFLVRRIDRSFPLVENVVEKVHRYVLAHKCRFSLSAVKKALAL